MTRRVASLLLTVLIFAATAVHAADAPKPFARTAAVKLLGYDPERSIADQCETRAGSVRIVRVSLMKQQPVADRVRMFLVVAGMTGAARAICPPASAPETLPPFAKPGEIFSDADCEAAGNFTVGKIRDNINDQIGTEHPDLVAGYVQGVADALPSIRDACEPHAERWARLAAQEQILTREAKSMRDGRTCSLWRKAFYNELHAASDMADKNGRAAGLAYLKSKPLITLAGSRSYCTDALGRAFEASNYDLTRTMINATPEK